MFDEFIRTEDDRGCEKVIACANERGARMASLMTHDIIVRTANGQRKRTKIERDALGRVVKQTVPQKQLTMQSTLTLDNLRRRTGRICREFHSGSLNEWHVTASGWPRSREIA